MPQMEYVDTDTAGVRRFYNNKVEQHGGELFHADDKSLLSYLPDLTVWKSLLDVGCGVGNLVRYAMARRKVTIGIDLSDKSVEVARKSGLNVMVGDMASLPFEDSSFDLVTCLGALEHTVEPRVALGEMFRVARKYVVLVLPMWYEDAEGPISRYYKEESFPNIERWLPRGVWEELVRSQFLQPGVMRSVLVNQDRDVLLTCEKE